MGFGGTSCDLPRAVADHDYLRAYLKSVIKDPKVTIGKIESAAEWTWVSAPPGSCSYSLSHF